MPQSAGLRSRSRGGSRRPGVRPVWSDWIRRVRRQIGMVDLADLIYVHSEYYELRSRADQPSAADGARSPARSKAGDVPARPSDAPVLFGERRGADRSGQPPQGPAVPVLIVAPPTGLSGGAAAASGGCRAGAPAAASKAAGATGKPAETSGGRAAGRTGSDQVLPAAGARPILGKGCCEATPGHDPTGCGALAAVRSRAAAACGGRVFELPAVVPASGEKYGNFSLTVVQPELGPWYPRK